DMSRSEHDDIHRNQQKSADRQYIGNIHRPAAPLDLPTSTLITLFIIPALAEKLNCYASPLPSPPLPNFCWNAIMYVVVDVVLDVVVDVVIEKMPRMGKRDGGEKDEFA